MALIKVEKLYKKGFTIFSRRAVESSTILAEPAATSSSPPKCLNRIFCVSARKVFPLSPDLESLFGGGANPPR